jgi:hypothetical protein
VGSPNLLNSTSPGCMMTLMHLISSQTFWYRCNN